MIIMVTNWSNRWSQSVTNKIILSRGCKLISIHLGHSSVAFNMYWLSNILKWEFSCSFSSCVNVQDAQKAKLRILNTDDNLRERTNIPWFHRVLSKLYEVYHFLYITISFSLLVTSISTMPSSVHTLLSLFLDRCKRVWSVPPGPRREAVCPWVCERPRLVPLLLPQRVQVAPWWAELRGWVTRVYRGQRLIHRALAADLAGYVAPERNTCDLERSIAFTLCRYECQPQTLLPLPSAPLNLKVHASGMNDLTLSHQKGSLGHEAFIGD